MNLTELTNKIFNKNFRFLLLALILIELISLSGYLVPHINTLGFFIILIIVLILTLKDLKYGVFFVLAELFIGSKGYLFYFETGGIIVSLRIALWIIIMASWLSKFIISFFKKEEKSIFLNAKIWKTGNLPYFLVLFLFIVWGVINGFLNNNSFSNIFFDGNAWLYFAMIFPIYEVAGGAKNLIRQILQIFFACTLWLCLKTLFLLFVFSHNLIGMVYEVYRWIRVTGVGEITNMESGFIRIFFQSHLFVLIGFFIILFVFNEFDKKKKESWIYFIILIIFSSVAILSFSRSFWVGMLASLLIWAIVAVKRYGWKNLFSTTAVLLASLILAIGLIAGVIKFPYPKPHAFFDLNQLADRASKIDESAISSRYALLPELLKKIRENPILGQGFGTTVTYQTSDPRVLETTTRGTYTTYAFEWGWLDIWLKLSLIGFLFYLFLIGKIAREGLMLNNWLASSLIIGLLLIAITSFFSPYTNHPLGIGYLILTAAILSKNKE